MDAIAAGNAGDLEQLMFPFFDKNFDKKAAMKLA